MTTCSRVSERSFSLLVRQLKQVLDSEKEKLIKCLRSWTRPINPSGMVSGAGVDATRSRSALIAGNMLLRQHLIVLQRQVERPKLTWRERFTMVLLARWVGERWQEAVMVVQPETILRWHRDAYRMVWRQKTKRKGKGGRPPLSPEKVADKANGSRESAVGCRADPWRVAEIGDSGSQEHNPEVHLACARGTAAQPGLEGVSVVSRIDFVGEVSRVY